MEHTQINTAIPVDAQTRQRALAADTSFIVQAPAGSGKTDILTRRILTLLATVEQPEEILAITFTRKAASEMRQRVLTWLQLASDRSSLTEAERADQHLQRALDLADAVLQRDKMLEWGLLKNPKRLSLQTIDSLCATLARQMPVTTNFGAVLSVEENASRLYQIAATRCIVGQLQENAPGHAALQVLLEHLDNNADRLKDLLTSMLLRRDQWLRPEYAELGTRGALEHALQEWIDERYAALEASMPPVINDSLAPTLVQIYEYMRVLELSGYAAAFASCVTLPEVSASNTMFWQALADTLLTKEGALRKRLDRNGGFPTSANDAKALGRSAAELKNRKTDFATVLEQLANYPDFVELLAEVRLLPSAAYEDAQWAVIESLWPVLRLAVAELHVVFAEQGLVDFSEISMRATNALGHEDEPTDLALVLDYRLRHILVDEFQDTSLSQFALFEKLVAGWEPGDGRTFFAVGDPMQSIYRFRNAEVGLFLHAWEHGVGNVALESLQLQVNFRSRPEIVDWCNNTFSLLFPSRADARTGAITYAGSQAFRATAGQCGCKLHPFVDTDKAEQAEHLVNVVAQSLQDTEGDVAILVRSKAALTEIFPALQQRNITYQAIDIETLGDRLVVKDLQSLTAALLHPQDKLHWLAVLRSPWCGLTLADLYVLASDEDVLARQPDVSESPSSQEPQADLFASASEPPVTVKTTDSIWSRLNDPSRYEQLSVDGQRRVQRLVSVLTPALMRSGRDPLVPWVESCWLQLGGPAQVSARDRLAAEACLRELAVIEAAGLLGDYQHVSSRLSALFTPPEQGDDVRVQIMTIHKSKGLEFETVLLPSLGRGAGRDSNELLNFFEYKNSSGQSRLLLAPIPEPNSGRDNPDPLLKLVRQQEKTRADQELVRLLYVAATRARSHLHLFGEAKVQKKGLTAEPNTLLSLLWSVVSSDFEELHAAAIESEAGETDSIKPMDGDDPSRDPPAFRRLAADTPLMDFQSRWAGLAGVIPDTAVQDVVEFDWAGMDARHIGTAIHRQLQRLTDEGLQHWSATRLIEERPTFRLHLQQQGVPPERLDKAVERLTQAMQNVLGDPRAQWLLGPQQEARSEFRLTGFVDGKLVNRIIDRTFVEDGVRWIVDYKTGDHRGGQLQDFLDREQQRYRHQLEEYVLIMRELDARPIRLGLYFPLIQGFIEWEPDEVSAT